MKLVKRVGCAALACAMLFSLSVPTFADAAVTKDETIFVTLAPDGSVDKETVSVWLHSDSGLRNLADQSNLQNLADLHGEVTPRVEGGSLYWDTDERDIYYQGDSSASLPISVVLTYKMDGVEMSAEEITGKSGHFAMTVELINNRGSVQEVGGQNRTIYKPYVCAVGAMLNTDDYKNIKSDHGTQNTDSGNTAVAYVLMPGMAKSFSGLLTGNLSDLADKLFDSVTLEADVENLEIPSLYIACASSAEDLLDLESDDPDDESLDDLFDDMDDLRDATNDLLDGTKELFDGTGDLYDAVFGELTDGTNELKDGTSELRDKVSGELNDGVDDLNDGAKKLDDGATELNDKVSSELKPGVSALSDGAKKLGGGTTQLYSGVQALNGKLAELDSQSDTLTAGGLKIVATLLDGITAQINGQISALGIDYTIDTLTLENYPTVLGGLMNNLQVPVYNMVYGQVKDGLTEKFTTSTRQDVETAVIQDAAKSWWYGNTAETALSGADLEAQTNAILESKAGEIEAAVNDALTNAANPYYPAAQQQLQAGLQQAQTQMAPMGDTLTAIVTQLGDVKTFAEGLPEYTSYVGDFVDATGKDSDLQKGAAALDEGVNGKGGLLAGTSTLKKGASDLLDGTDALKDGTGELKDGVTKLYDKMPDLVDGVAELDDGVSDLVDGVSDLRDGATDLRDGAKELDDGMNEYNDEGISKLTDNDDLDKIQDLYDVAQAIKDKAEEPSDFTGTIQNADITTKFVMRTTVPEAPSDEGAEVEEAPQSFWQKFVGRFKNLFGLD